MKKKRKSIIFLISILILIYLILLILANQNNFFKREQKLIWVYIDPTQCFDWDVPNEIYFEGNPSFSRYENGTEYPLKFNQTQNMFDYINEEINIYEKALRKSNYTEEEINNFTKDLVEDYSYFFEENELSTKIVYIYDSTIFKFQGGGGTCSACGCSAGYSLHILIDEKDFETFSEIGYKLVDLPSING